MQISYFDLREVPVRRVHTTGDAYITSVMAMLGWRERYTRLATRCEVEQPQPELGVL